MVNLIGKRVKYKEGNDPTEYLVLDYAPMKNPTEICIIETFPFHPNRMKQLQCWHSVTLFNIIKEK